MNSINLVTKTYSKSQNKLKYTYTSVESEVVLHFHIVAMYHSKCFTWSTRTFVSGQLFSDQIQN